MDQNCREFVLSEDYAEFIVENGPTLESFMAMQNACSAPINDTHAVVYVPIASLPANLIQLYGYSIYPNCFGLLDTGSLEASGVNRIRNLPVLDFRGRGILIGIIDTGIDYRHSAFKNADGTSKIISIWDQTIQTGSSPEGFFYGTEYTQEQINLALQNTDPLSVVPSVDEYDHGTFLAGIAAGTANVEINFDGVVPDAEIVVVKLKQAKQFIRDFFFIPRDAVCYQEIDIMFAVNYLLSISNRLMRPLSICIGFGTSQGAHDERGALSSYLSDVADTAGRAVSIAGGNEGTSRHHFQETISRGTESVTVELRVGPNEGGFSMELWGNAPSTFSIDILSPTGEFIPRIPARIGETRVIRFIFEATIIYLDYQVIEAQTGDQLILMRFSSPAEGIWRFRVYSNIDLDSHFHIWLPMSNFISDATYFTQSSPETTLTSPGNTIIPLVVTAYDYTNQSLYLNASRGFTRTNNISPELAAPGVNLIGPAPDNSYRTGNGTSISAAHAAGIAAIILEWGVSQNVLYDSVEIKNFLIRGATRDPNISYPNPEWGYGIIDIYDAFRSLREEVIG
ncbi:S8 family serine peptidase [Anaerocolumna sedimenticola]|uniref:S8 family serine peptidase n=1 Tax=Anaerocolumna sedimenticola TaxID=2696063 RepID=A0A6P1TMW4_9FIRM|nr:S8 family peptidase [Anaerocolumna sedimenticola]QHQ61529.1 S8 family serine peptidase [Anaerocolumna sedimenticola]